MVTTTRSLLADGRRIVFFDEHDVGDRDVRDTRALAAMPTTSKVRWDTLTGEPVVVASHRHSRTYLPPDDQCPLCPSTPDRATEIPAASYDVVVFENRFPAFPGRCEVMCFTDRHDASFASLSPARVRTVMAAWVDRTVELSALADVAQVFCFENRGAEIGVTLSHPHGQVYGYPFVTPRTVRVLDRARAHERETGRNLFDDVVETERQDGRRVVATSAHWIAFVPQAARWPFEVHIYPNRRVPGLPELDDEERADFGPLYVGVLLRLDALFGVPMPYVAAWHQAPVARDRDLMACHLELFSSRRAVDKLKYLAGSESAMDVFINDIPPEEAARMLAAR